MWVVSGRQRISGKRRETAMETAQRRRTHTLQDGVFTVYKPICTGPCTCSPPMIFRFVSGLVTPFSLVRNRSLASTHFRRKKEKEGERGMKKEEE